jgi:hypothetical protein
MILTMPSTHEHRFYELGQRLAGLKTINETTSAKAATIPIASAMTTIRTLIEDPFSAQQIFRPAAEELLKVLSSCKDYIFDLLNNQKKPETEIPYKVRRIKKALANFEALLFLDPPLANFLQDHPDPSGCGFLMMPFREMPVRQSIDKCIREVCLEMGLQVLRADDPTTYSENIFMNIRTYMHGCGFGIAVFERLEHEYPNPNVSLEVGYMRALGKPLCSLKDRMLRGLPSDLGGELYIDFDVQRIEDTLPPVLSRWIKGKRLDRREEL